MGLGSLSLELLLMITEHLERNDLHSLAQTCKFLAVPSQDTLRKHIKILHQSAEQVYQLARHVVETNGFSDGIHTLCVNNVRLNCDISPVPSSHQNRVKEWVDQLFPIAQSMEPAIQQFREECCKRWREASLQPDVTGLLAHVIVRCKNLRQLHLQVSELVKKHNFSQLLLSKLRFDAMCGALPVLARLKSLTMYPPWMNPIVPVVSCLEHLEMRDTDQTLRIQAPESYAAIKNLKTLSVSCYNAGSPFHTHLGYADLRQLEAISLSEPHWHRYNYRALATKIHSCCPSLHTLLLDYDRLMKDDTTTIDTLTPDLLQLYTVTSLRVHLYHLPRSCRDFTFAELTSVVPPSVERMEVSGISRHNFDSIMNAYSRGWAIDVVFPKNLHDVRLVLDLDLMSNVEVGIHLMLYNDMFQKLVMMAEKEGIRLGVYTRRTGDTEARDEHYMGKILEPIQLRKM